MWKIRDLEREIDRLTESNASYITTYIKSICKKCGSFGMSDSGCANCKEQEILLLRAALNEVESSLDDSQPAIFKCQLIIKKALK